MTGFLAPARLRRYAAMVLLLCFFLPLSKCTTTRAGGGIETDYRFAFEHITEPVLSAASGTGFNTDSLPLMAATIAIFLVPAALLRLGAILQSAIHTVAAIPAEWLLYHLTFVGTPQVGGILAMIGWAVLMATGVATLWRRLRAR